MHGAIIPVPRLLSIRAWSSMLHTTLLLESWLDQIWLVDAVMCHINSQSIMLRPTG
jgi:hypothetical protein